MAIEVGRETKKSPFAERSATILLAQIPAAIASLIWAFAAYAVMRASLASPDAPVDTGISAFSGILDLLMPAAVGLGCIYVVWKTGSIGLGVLSSLASMAVWSIGLGLACAVAVLATGAGQELVLVAQVILVPLGLALLVRSLVLPVIVGCVIGKRMWSSGVATERAIAQQSAFAEALREQRGGASEPYAPAQTAADIVPPASRPDQSFAFQPDKSAALQPDQQPVPVAAPAPASHAAPQRLRTTCPSCMAGNAPSNARCIVCGASLAKA